MNFNNLSVVIVGMGRVGQSTLAYLQKHYPGCDVTTVDQNNPGYPISLANWDVAIVSPGVRPDDPLLKTANQITTSTNIFMDECEGRVVMVTGSKGKSTTASLIHAMLHIGDQESYLVGNIGEASLSVLNDHNEKDAIYVFELSSAQAMRLTKGPDIAVILNLFPEHMDYHGSEEAYYAAKLNVAKVQTEDQVLIHGPGVNARLDGAVAQAMTWEDVDLSGAEFSLKGEHNLENMKAAAKVARELGVEDEAIMATLKAFSPLPHRLEFVGMHKEIFFYNDSISTAPEATMAALEALDEVGTLILGGMDRGYDFTALAKDVVAKEVPNVVLFPDSGAKIRVFLERDGYEGTIFETDSMEAAVKWAYEYTPKGTICLLSPGAPSYNLFKNFEERGEAFSECLLKSSVH